MPNTSEISIEKASNHFIVNEVIIPFMKKGKLNIYTPEQINALGGMNGFLDVIASKKPIKIPTIEFSEKEWDDMEKLLKEDK
jgi:hypothetical protein